MYRVERHIILNNKSIDNICFLSKNLYNLANYYIRKEFINNKKWLRYGHVYKLIKNSLDYKALPAQTAQQILRLLDKNWISFFNSIKVYKKNNFSDKPKLPKYKHKEKGRNIIIFTNQQVHIKDSIIKFPKRSGLSPLKTKVNNLFQVRIIPQTTCYVVEVVYNKEVNVVKTIKNNYLSIDLGVNNLATCTNNIGNNPFIVNGRILKSINQYFNKKKAQLSSLRTKGKNAEKIEDKKYFCFTKKMHTLTHKRANKINDYLHKSSRFIISYCIENKIGTIIIGKNNNWKQNITLNKKNKQNFINIPFNKLIDQIQYKAEEVGISVICNDESYTSKCSFLDLEIIKNHASYMGKRIKRGLFKSAKGILINADVNGSLNILRKAVPKVFTNGIEAVGLQPIVINI